MDKCRFQYFSFQNLSAFCLSQLHQRQWPGKDLLFLLFLFPSSLLLSIMSSHFVFHRSHPLFLPLHRVYSSQLAVCAGHANTPSSSPHASCTPALAPTIQLPLSQVASAAVTWSATLIGYQSERTKLGAQTGRVAVGGVCWNGRWFEGQTAGTWTRHTPRESEIWLRVRLRSINHC